MTRDEFIEWAVPSIEKFFEDHPNERPVLHRTWNSELEKWNDYELGGMEMVTREEHSKIHYHYFKVNSPTLSLLGLFYMSQKTK